jgi:uncharacterized protein
LLVASVLLLLLYFAIPWIPLPFAFPDTSWMTSHAAEARHIYGSGGFLDILRFRIVEGQQIAKLHIYIFARTLALILLGAWLWRSGAIRRLGNHGAALLIAGIALVAVGLLLTAQRWGYLVLVEAGPFSSFPRKFAHASLNDLAPVVTALGYAGLVLAGSGSAAARKILHFAVPVGRMAFSNYITQSIVLGFLFYGYGFGLMGRAGAAVGLGIAVAIYAIQAGISRWWLERCRFGPLEWLWRTLMYGESQPWRRRATAPAITPAGALP